MSGPRPVHQAVGGYGEPDEVRELVVMPPEKYRDRYRVTARGVMGPGQPPKLDTVTVSAGGIVATFGADGRAVLEAPAGAELRLFWPEAQELAGWARRKLGRPSGFRARVDAMVEAARAGHITRDGAAQFLGRADDWGEPQSDFKRDVSRAGGWDAILRLAGKF